MTLAENNYDPGYFVGWFTLSLINAGLAAALNRSALLWWILSLFLGPIATLLLAISGKAEKQR